MEVSGEAADFVRARGGRLWVWSATPRLCCSGTPAMMHAATEPPPGLTGFTPAGDAPLEVWFRAPGGRRPEVLGSASPGGAGPGWRRTGTAA